MGISGLLPLLKPACRPASLSDFKGSTVAIDVYCWLHKGAFGCAEQLVQGRYTDGYIKYVMKYINILLYHDIKPILVFDGRNLPSKSETEKKRRKNRKENREKAVQMLKEGKTREAREYFQRSVDITPAMAREVISACRERNIDCIVAPYEADSQLAYLNMAGLADIVITEDSDLTLFGCDKIMFKLQDTGDGVLYERDNLGKVFGIRADSFNFDKFRYMGITAGCDYLASLPGIGLGKAKTFWQKVTNPDLRNVLRKIPAYLKMPGTIVTDEYIERFIKANNTFLYQVVFDPVTRKERPLTPYPTTLQDSPTKMTYCGSYSPPATATQLALGNLDLHTLAQVSSYCPDNPPCPVDKPKYGARAGHGSVWCGGKKDLFTQKDKTSQNKGCAFEMGGGSSRISGNSATARGEMRTEVNIGGKGGEKRKSEIVTELVTEDKIEQMLAEEKSPPHKKAKLDKLSKFKKILNTSENDSVTGVVTVSKYFACGGDGSERLKKQEVIEKNVDESPTAKVDQASSRGRRLSTGSSGTWFKHIEEPSTADGKFIYRTEGDVDNTSSVLKEISNSPETKEDLERKKKRNPFAVKLKSKECTSLVPSSPLKSRESSSLPPSSPSVCSSELSSPPPCTPSIPSSQLSMYSMDGGDSIIFSSQENGSDHLSANTLSSPPSLDSPAPSVLRQASSPAPSAPRLGLSKFAFNTGKSTTFTGSNHTSRKNSLGPARVSGLSKSGTSGGSRGVAGSGLKQASLTEMFGRSRPKANLGGKDDSVK